MKQENTQRDNNAPDRLLNLRQACFKTCLSKTAIYELLKTEEFPAKIKFGRSTRWSENEIDAWILEAKLKRA